MSRAWCRTARARVSALLLAGGRAAPSAWRASGQPWRGGGAVPVRAARQQPARHLARLHRGEESRGSPDRAPWRGFGGAESRQGHLRPSAPRGLHPPTFTRWLYAHLDRFARLTRRPVLGRRGGGHQGTAASVEARSGAGAASCSQCAVCEQIETRGSGCNGRLGVNKDLLGRARSPCSERAGKGGRLAVPVVLATRKQSIEQAPVACQAPRSQPRRLPTARSIWHGVCCCQKCLAWTAMLQQRRPATQARQGRAARPGHELGERQGHAAAWIDCCCGRQKSGGIDVAARGGAYLPPLPPPAAAMHSGRLWCTS